MITNRTQTDIFTLFIDARQLEQALKQQFIKLNLSTIHISHIPLAAKTAFEMNSFATNIEREDAVMITTCYGSLSIQWSVDFIGQV